MYCPMEVPPLALLCSQRPDMGLSNKPAKLFVIKVRGKREIMSSSPARHEREECVLPDLWER